LHHLPVLLVPLALVAPGLATAHPSFTPLGNNRYVKVTLLGVALTLHSVLGAGWRG